MASCITLTTIYAHARSGATANTAYSLPVLTTNSSPAGCALVVMTGTEYANNNSAINNINTQGITNSDNITQTNTDLTNLTSRVATLETSAGSPQASEYDYTQAAAMWGFAFTMTFALWFVSKNIGLIINAIKRW
jgi:hypothetical protein